MSVELAKTSILTFNRDYIPYADVKFDLVGPMLWQSR